jgi:hypothetical protein
MKDKATLSITSLLSILFFAFHWADDIVRGIATGASQGWGPFDQVWHGQASA